jgi:adenylylsulfate kinase-like enzyme
MMEQRAFVLLITGPAGAGKSAAAAAWAAGRATLTAHIALDDVREFIAADYADPRDGWTIETQRQYDIARPNCADMARRYVAAGITCVITTRSSRSGRASTTRDGAGFCPTPRIT